jgi:hypothetical protein
VGTIRHEIPGEAQKVPTISRGDHAVRIKVMVALHAVEDILHPIPGAVDLEATPGAGPRGRMARHAIVIQMNHPTTTGSAIRRRASASWNAHALSEAAVPAE